MFIRKGKDILCIINSPFDWNGDWILSQTGENVITFTGKERDAETGYSYFGARYYDSDLSGLFLSVDPMADKYPSISPYAYCAWNPLKLVDPNGQDIDSSSVSNKIWNRVNPNHDSYNKEFEDVFNQLAEDHSTLFKFNEWESPKVSNGTSVKGRITMDESNIGQQDKVTIGYYWEKDNESISPERYLYEEVFHAKQFLDGEFGYGRSSSKGYWCLIAFDLVDEEEAHKWADRVSNSSNSWTVETMNYYLVNRGLKSTSRNVTEQYMKYDNIERTNPPNYDANGIYKDPYRTMRRPKK